MEYLSILHTIIVILLRNCLASSRSLNSITIGRSVRSTTASVIQIPTTTPTPTTPIIPKKNHETSTVGTVQPRQLVLRSTSCC